MPSLENNFEAETANVKRAEGTGIPKKYLSERRGGAGVCFRRARFGEFLELILEVELLEIQIGKRLDF